MHDRNLPENSLAAVEGAFASGYHAEIDVRLTSDGCVVVFHDHDLARMTGESGLVESRRWEELRSMRLSNTSHPIPSLAQILPLIPKGRGLCVEIKSDRPAGLFEETIAREIKTAPVAVMSFNPDTVAWFQKWHPQIPCGQLACSFNKDPMPLWKKFLRSRYATGNRPDFAGHRWQDLPARSLLGRRLRIPVLAWTVTSPEEAKQALRHADNIIFEGFTP